MPNDRQRQHHVYDCRHRSTFPRNHLGCTQDGCGEALRSAQGSSAGQQWIQVLASMPLDRCHATRRACWMHKSNFRCNGAGQMMSTNQPRSAPCSTHDVSGSRVKIPHGREMGGSAVWLMPLSPKIHVPGTTWSARAFHVSPVSCIRYARLGLNRRSQRWSNYTQKHHDRRL